ncbi:MAG: fumarylacetoacetate hydrolase family protein, partial [Lysobacterales bacterium]
MNYAIEPAAITTLAVTGIAERFPVNRIFCVGRNYAAHAREMGKDPDRDPPFFFMKPANAAVDASSPV